MRLWPILYFNVLVVAHYHKCSWKTCIYAHTDTRLETVSSQLWTINVSLVHHSLGDKGRTQHRRPFFVSQTKVTMEISALSAVHQHWLKTCSQFLGFTVIGDLWHCAVKIYRVSRRRGLPRCVICLELPIKIETFIQITLCRFCIENVKCLIQDKTYVIRF